MNRMTRIPAGGCLSADPRLPITLEWTCDCCQTLVQVQLSGPWKENVTVVAKNGDPRVGWNSHVFRCPECDYGHAKLFRVEVDVVFEEPE